MVILGSSPGAIRMRLGPRAAGQSWDGTKFTFDSVANAKSTIKVWPTGETGTCGDLTGEIVKFAGIKK